MDQCTHEVRAEYWKGIIKACGQRPSGQSAKNWMEVNGICEQSYYHWQRKFRQKAYEEMRKKQWYRSGSGRKGGTFFCWNSLLLFSKEKRADDFRQHGCSHRYFYIKENYQEMQERIKCLPSDDEIEGSTNFGKFIEYFSMDDSKWIQIINKDLEEWLVFRKRMGYFWFCIAALIGKY